MTGADIIGIAATLVLVVGPLLLGLAGWLHAGRRRSAATPADVAPWRWKRTMASALLYTLAFNLTFFIQELFLVLPKALTPGLRPTLFHNNHTWKGDNPLANLFQGTGALATLISGIACMLLLRHGRIGSPAARLFLAWMAYCGFFMALPQVAIGALGPHSDLGMAMGYLGLTPTTRLLAALLALAAIPPIALWLGRPLLGLAGSTDQAGSPKARTRFVFQVATLPSLVALPMIIAFRVPREWVEVAILPLLVTLVGISWIQAGAWRNIDAGPGDAPAIESVAWPLAAVLSLLLAFQLLLRPGIPFY